MPSNPMRTGPDGWAYHSNPTREVWACDDCGYRREFAETRTKAPHCPHHEMPLTRLEAS